MQELTSALKASLSLKDISSASRASFDPQNPTLLLNVSSFYNFSPLSLPRFRTDLVSTSVVALDNSEDWGG